MRDTFSLTLMLALGLVGTAMVNNLEAQKVIEVRETLSGTVHRSSINPGGEPDGDSGLGICEGSGNNYKRVFRNFRIMGSNQFSCRTITQLADEPVGVDTPNCPGAVEVPITSYSHVQRFKDGEGSLLFSQMDPSGPNFVCMSPGSNTFKAVMTSTYEGGTGRFEGASGTASWEFDNTVLLTDPSGGILMFGSQGTTVGTLLLP
jgi:hypothetical protein